MLERRITEAGIALSGIANRTNQLGNDINPDAKEGPFLVWISMIWSKFAATSAKNP